MNTFGKSLLGTAAIGSLAIAAPASATTTVSNETTVDLRGNGGSGSYGNTRTFDANGNTVVASGWSYDGHMVRAGALGQWDRGLGVMNSTGDNSHTVDNSGWLDFVVFQFDSAVSLDSAGFFTGFHGMYDTDATIGVSNLTAPFTGNLSSFTFFDSNGPLGNNTRGINPNGLIGTTWLIGASATNRDGRIDGFKIGSIGVTGAAGAVPEPATWAMMLLGFGFAGAAMRRGKTQQRLRVAYA